MRSLKNSKILIFIAALVLLVAAILSLGDNLFSPYVTFQYTQQHPGKYVQVIGKHEKTGAVNHDASGFGFTLNDDKGTKLDVYHNGVKPANFEHAEQVVVLGKFSAEKKIFEADKVLVKCPSKYQKENK